MKAEPTRIAAVRRALGRSDFAGAEQLAASVVAAFPEDAEGRFLLGMARAEAGRVGAGIADIERAVELDPQGGYRAQLARLQVMLRQDGAAAQTLAAAEGAMPVDALGRDTLGCVYARLGEHAASVPHFRAAVQMAPGNVSFRYNLAAALNFIGDTDGAEAEAEALIALDPDYAKAHHMLAGLRKHSAERNHVERLTAALARAQAPEARLLLGYALAKELEDIGDQQAAFGRLAAANAEHRVRLPYAFARDAANFDAIERTWPKVAASTVQGAPKDAPIFVIGMPRTGTTLVDRILSQHSQVKSAGELSDFALELKRRAGTPSAYVLNAATLAAGHRLDLSALGKAYVSRARRVVGQDVPKFVDKMPLNFFYVPLILRALPRARVVCVRRHPLDTILSNYRQLFATGYSYYGYAQDLVWTADYYVRFDRLISVFRQALPPEQFTEVAYEDVVADIEREARRLIGFCGLAWEQQCVNFHENAAPVATASSSQVRQPLYATSVGRWRRYFKHLKPAIDVLEANGIAI